MTPVCIGPDNAREAVGANWEWVSDQARRLRVPFLGTKKKRVINAAAFLAALEADRVQQEAEPVDAADAAEIIRTRLGLVRRTP
jgi:hypothetical protein